MTDAHSISEVTRSAERLTRSQSEPGSKPRGDETLASGPVRAADSLVDRLVTAGIRMVFGVPGGTIAPVLDALIDRPEVRVVSTRHESGAMFAAAGFARQTGQPAVVCVTSGPGFFNAMTGLASAHCERVPVLLLVGEVARELHGRAALQEGTAHHLGVVNIARSVSKFAAEVTSVESLIPTLHAALAQMMTPPEGPAVLTLPVDLLRAPVVAPRVGCMRPDVPVFDSLGCDVVDAAAAELSRAQHPLVLAGAGVRAARAQTSLLRFAESAQIPVATTPKGKGVFPESHPLSVGVFGHGGHPSAVAYARAGVDVLLAVGTRLTDPSSDSFSGVLRPRRALIHLDIDARPIGRCYPATHALIGPLGSLLEALRAKTPQASARRTFGVTHAQDASRAACAAPVLGPREALAELQAGLPRDTLYTADIGHHLLFATYYLRLDPPGDFLVMNGLASMGSGMGGNELLARVKEQYPGTVRIIITAYSDLGPILRSLNDGLVARYLIKPWDHEELAGILAWAVEAYLVGHRTSAMQLRLAQNERLATLGTIAACVLHDVAQPLSYMALAGERLTELAAVASRLSTEASEARHAALRENAGGTLDSLSAELAVLAEDIREGTRLMRELIERAPQITSPLPGFPDAAPSDASLAARRAIALARHLVTIEGGTVECVTPEAPAMVPLPETEVLQLLLNLITNSAQALAAGATPEPRVRVVVALDAAHVRLSVRDNGPGMSPEILARATKPFFTTRAHGAGLGLMQCRRIVEGAGGTLAIESAPGAGSRIEIRFSATPR